MRFKRRVKEKVKRAIGEMMENLSKDPHRLHPEDQKALDLIQKGLDEENSKREAMESEAMRIYKNTGRNDPCPCASGKKFKKCCLR